MRDRVISEENEFGFILLDPDGKTFEKADNEVMMGQLFVASAQCTGSVLNPRVSGVKGDIGAWITNGAKIYIDHGPFPEYAGPECRGAREAALYNQAGMRIMADIFSGMQADGSRIVLVKNNLGAFKETLLSFGAHENYQIFDLLPGSAVLAQSLVPFLAARQIIGGNGWWDESGTYYYSQRTLRTYSDTGSLATEKRSILNTRDEPHTGNLQNHTRRLHLTIGDALMSSYQTWLVFGITALVISMVEDGRKIAFGYEKKLRARGIPQIVAEMREVNADVAGYGQNTLITLGDGSRLSAYDLQARYCENARNYLRNASFESEASAAEARDILREWEAALNALYRRDDEWLAAHFDYATKNAISCQMADRRKETKQPLTPEKLRKFRKEVDFRYHIVPFTGYETLREGITKRYALTELFTAAEIARAQCEPPQTTRARMRGEYVRMIREHPDLLKEPRIDWTYMSSGTGAWCPIEDPLCAEKPEFDLFLNAAFMNVHAFAK